MSNSHPVQPWFSGRIALISKIKRSAVPALCAALFAALISCSPAVSPKTSSSGGAISEQPAIDPIMPPSLADRPLQPGQSGTAYTPDGMPALMPSKGVNADMLFADRVSGDEARFKRLENAVVDLRREFDAVRPAIVRLTAVESDMEELVMQLQSLTPGAGNAQMHVSDAMPMPDIGPMPQAMSDELMETPKPKRAKIKVADVTPPPAPDEQAFKAPRTIAKEQIAKPEKVKAPQSAPAPVPEKVAKAPEITPAAQETPPAPVVQTPNKNTAAIQEAIEKTFKPVTVQTVTVEAAPKAEPMAMTIEPLPPEAISPAAGIAVQKAASEKTPAPAVAEKIETPKTVKPSGPPQITGVRFGEHDGKTRIVIDASARVSFNQNIDNSEHLLLIELPDTAWTGPTSGAPQSAIVSSWTAEASGGGTILAVSLKNNAVMASADKIDAANGAPYRIVFDLKTSP